MGDEKLASKVKTQEYVPPTEARKSKSPTLKAGDIAEQTIYVTHDGKVTTTPPEAGRVLVGAGDVVTEQIARAMNG